MIFKLFGLTIAYSLLKGYDVLALGLLISYLFFVVVNQTVLEINYLKYPQEPKTQKLFFECFSKASVFVDVGIILVYFGSNALGMSLLISSVVVPSLITLIIGIVLYLREDATIKRLFFTTLIGLSAMFFYYSVSFAILALLREIISFI